MNVKQSGHLGPGDTKLILRQLEQIGLDDDIYQEYLHHLGHKIADMYKYNAKAYLPNSPNLVLHRKLVWMLNEYQREGLRAADKEKIKSLALATKKVGWNAEQ